MYMYVYVYMYIYIYISKYIIYTWIYESLHKYEGSGRAGGGGARVRVK